MEGKLGPITLAEREGGREREKEREGGREREGERVCVCVCTSTYEGHCVLLKCPKTPPGQNQGPQSVKKSMIRL